MTTIRLYEVGKLGRDALLTFEGIDRSGKTTQSQRLVRTLELLGILAELVRFPDRTTVTRQPISAYLEKKLDLGTVEVHLLFMKNRQEKRAWLEESLKAGKKLW